MLIELIIMLSHSMNENTKIENIDITVNSLINNKINNTYPWIILKLGHIVRRLDSSCLNGIRNVERKYQAKIIKYCQLFSTVKRV